MAKQGDADRDVSDEASTFRAAMQGVKPLPQAASRIRPVARRPRKPQRAAPTLDADLEAQMPLVDAHLDAAAALSYRSAGVRDAVLRRLRRGLYPVEDQLDLHGLNQAQARMLLADFLAASCGAGLRCVRIIHGKGLRSGGRGAVLKCAIDTWLRRHQDVIAFVSARPIDGGTGAVYVLLRS